MNKPDYWYPQPELLLLTYKSNNTKYHGLDHVLRVWLYANLISQNISEKHDNKVVSATALFHEYGRDSDRKNSEHIETANRWIDKTFPILWPDFDPYQRDMFKVCNNYHEITDQSGSPIEAEIINDANILDGRNIPLGKVNTDDLILLVSQDLVEISQNIYKRWQYHKSRGHNEFSTFRRILKDFPQLNIDLPKNLKKYLDEHEDRDWDLHFRSLEEIYTDLERRCVSFQNSLLRGENIIRSANEIEQILDLIEQINWQGDVTTQSLIFNSNQLTFRSIKIGLVDHGIHPSKRKIIKRLYNRSKKRRDSIIFEEISMKGIYKFIQSNGSKKYPNIQNSLLQYLSVRDHNIEILTYLIFSKDPESEYFCSALNDKYPINLTTMLKGMKSDQLERYSWLYINANDSLCEKSNGMIESEDTLIAEKILQNIIDRSVDMISNVDLCVKQCQKILETINKIIQSRYDYSLDISFERLQTLINNTLSTNVDPNFISQSNSLSSKNLNVFNMYDGSSEEIGKFLQVFETVLISLCNEDWNCDDLIYEYLLPCSINREFNYTISEELIKGVEDPQISINTRELIKTSSEKNKDSHQIVLKYLEDRSRDNLEKILDPSKYHPQVSNKSDYYVVSNPIRVSTLSYVIENETTLLSIYNVLKADRLVFEHELNKIEGDYYSRIRYRDGLERANFTRRPNILADHIYYGMLINENDQFIYRKYLDKSDYCLLVFEEEIALRSIFNLHDASWVHQQKDVLFNDAKYIYEKIRDQVMEKSSVFDKHYVEAGITGGVNNENISKVLLNKKAIKRNTKELNIVKEALPNIEIVEVG